MLSWIMSAVTRKDNVYITSQKAIFNFQLKHVSVHSWTAAALADLTTVQNFG